jgi:hypothetical protein
MASACVPVVPAYTNVAHQGACSSADLEGFLTACELGAPPAQCTSWFASNPGCGACVLPAADSGADRNSGALLVDAAGLTYPNVAGCVQVIDGNTTCAAPLEALTLCELDACDSASCQLYYSAGAFDPVSKACRAAAGNSVCSPQRAAVDAACSGADSADGGALSMCDPSSQNGLILTIYAICGNGS